MSSPYKSYESEITWEAVYDNGVESLFQYAPDGTPTPYTEINRTRLTHFRMWGQGRVLLMLCLDPGQRLIWRRRVEVPKSGVRIVHHLCGWQITVGKGQDKRNVQSIAYLTEGQSAVIMAGRWRVKGIEGGGGIMYPVNIQEQEQERD